MPLLPPLCWSVERKVTADGWSAWVIRHEYSKCFTGTSGVHEDPGRRSSHADLAMQHVPFCASNTCTLLFWIHLGRRIARKMRQEKNAESGTFLIREGRMLQIQPRGA